MGLRFSILGLVGLLACPSLLSGEESYELRGQVRLPDGQSFRNTPPVIFIQGALDPFLSTARAGLDGKFKIKDLEPGPYTVVVAVPRRGQMQWTVEIGPSFSDARNRVEMIFQFNPAKSKRFDHTVSANRLLIPRRAEREYERAQDRLRERDVSGAVGHLEKALELAPRFASAWNQLGTIAYHQGALDDAESDFRKALEQESGLYAPLVNLGGVLISRGRFEEALEFNQDAVRRRPDDPLAQSQLGRNYFHLGRLEEARNHLERCKALDPSHFSYPRLILAELYSRQGDRAAAARELREFLEFHPDSKLAARAQAQLRQLN